mmetsp:Transcript_125185/g.365601  ORF Transcript_125185/g.365601 Transcript_125185/m.365601 type:complete len:200 (+) Transcript_125185:323-922(+)
MKSCSILAPVANLSGSNGDCILSPLRTRIPPVFPPPTTSHMRPVSSRFCFSSAACWLASSLAVALFFAFSAWCEARLTTESCSADLTCASSSSLAAFSQGTSRSSRSFGRFSASPPSITMVMMEWSGALTLVAPEPATFSQKLTSLSLWFMTTTTRVSSPALWFMKAVTSSMSRLVLQTTRRAPGWMKRAKCARYQKAG